ncbi:GntR family transcriptional regulator [Jannaschia sp. LMIT008]|uniref:GntR family transcriptional regulator n=1 Tax=Jannaschia maritima TaxID=3032585 RepID=UPI00281152DA|nr:GntR family transcriptional regulator [Jannaschia sp. LMIT008]
MPLSVVKQGSVLGQVFDSLKSAIMMGEFEPSQKLRIDELADAFGTSHMPVREALGQLVVLGALESPPRRSVHVPKLSVEKLTDLMELRLLLETRAVELAAEAATPALIARLKKHHRGMGDLLERKALNLSAYLKLNYEFHFAIYEASGNAELIDMIETIWLRYGPMLNLLREKAWLGEGNQDHAEMIEGLERGDRARLQRGLQSDLNRAMNAITRGIASQEAAE